MKSGHFSSANDLSTGCEASVGQMTRSVAHCAVPLRNSTSLCVIETEQRNPFSKLSG